MWKRPSYSVRKVFPSLDLMLSDHQDRTVILPDIETLSRVESFLNASPIGYVVGPSDQLIQSSSEFCDGEHDLAFVSSIQEAKQALSESPNQTYRIYAMYLCQPSAEHLAD